MALWRGSVCPRQQKLEVKRLLQQGQIWGKASEIEEQELRQVCSRHCLEALSDGQATEECQEPRLILF